LLLILLRPDNQGLAMEEQLAKICDIAQLLRVQSKRWIELIIVQARKLVVNEC